MEKNFEELKKGTKIQVNFVVVHDRTRCGTAIFHKIEEYMNSESFKKWFCVLLIPILEEQSLIIRNIASCHNSLTKNFHKLRVPNQKLQEYVNSYLI